MQPSTIGSQQGAKAVLPGLSLASLSWLDSGLAYTDVYPYMYPYAVGHDYITPKVTCKPRSYPKPSHLGQMMTL